MRDEIIRDVSESMTNDIRALSSKFEKENVGFASTLRKVRELDGTAIKRTLGMIGMGGALGGVTLGGMDAGLSVINGESLVGDGITAVASTVLAVAMATLYGKLTDKEKDRMPVGIRDFKDAHSMSNSQIVDLIKSKTPEQYEEMSESINAYRASQSYDGDSPAATSSRLKM